MKIFTRGGAISGNWELGRLHMANQPKNSIPNEILIAKTGRWKNRVNMDVVIWVDYSAAK